MTYRVYLRWNDQRVSDKTVTEDRALADLAFSAFPFRRAGSASTPTSDMSAPGLPTEAEYKAAYCKRTGRDAIEGWEFYLAFGLFRLASITQGVYRRVLSGSIASDFPPVSQAGELSRQALDILEG